MLYKTTFYNRKNKLESTSFHQYDANAHLVATRFYDQRGRPDGGEYFKVDERGNELSYSLYLKRGKKNKLYARRTKTNDGKNRLKEFTEYAFDLSNHYDSVIMVRISRYQYNSLDQVEETRVYNAKYELTEILYFKYDGEGNITEKLIHNNEGMPPIKETCGYLYDLQHNWIRKSSYINGNLDRVEKRKFEYYE